MFQKICLWASLMLTVNVAVAAGSELEISLKHNSPAEQQTAQELQHLVNSYDLSKYMFTHQVIIDQDAIPHSNPVLTLHTRHLGHDDRLLSAFVHEEIHWFVEAHEEDELQAEQEYRKLYPKVPVGYPEGAQDEESTYLHLTVCYLEYQAMKQLVGTDRARAVMTYWTTDHYTWVYKTLLTDESKIGAIVVRHKLVI